MDFLYQMSLIEKLSTRLNQKFYKILAKMLKI